MDLGPLPPWARIIPSIFYFGLSSPYKVCSWGFHLEQESSQVELSIARKIRSIFGFSTLKFLHNSKAIIHYFSSNLFLHFLSKITHNFYEGIECWKSLKLVPPLLIAIEKVQRKLENQILVYKEIRRVTSISFNFCTFKEHSCRRPWKLTSPRSCPIEIGSKDRIPIYNPFFLKLSIPLA